MLQSRNRHLLTSPCSWEGLIFLQRNDNIRRGVFIAAKEVTSTDCPETPKYRGTLVSRISSSSRIQLSGMIHGPLHTVSGADDNFIDSNLVKTHNISTHALPSPREVLAIDGNLIE